MTMLESVSSEMCWNEKKKNPSKTFNFPLIVGQLSVCTPDLSYASVSGGATVSGAKADCAECNVVKTIIEQSVAHKNPINCTNINTSVLLRKQQKCNKILKCFEALPIIINCPFCV